ncbi:MAG: hypothetical protein H7Y32_19430, partial [Chloroflexales bacterium]|nr:hypothetical protein [Chloroflexales bacterium]
MTTLALDTRVQLDPLAVSILRQQLSGALFTPADAGYDQARSHWNAHVDRRPALIAQCRS